MSRQFETLGLGLRLTADLLFPVALHAAELHVALTGDDDTGIGSAAQPWRTTIRASAPAEPRSSVADR